MAFPFLSPTCPLSSPCNTYLAACCLLLASHPTCATVCMSPLRARAPAAPDRTLTNTPHPFHSPNDAPCIQHMTATVGMLRRAAFQPAVSSTLVPLNNIPSESAVQSPNESTSATGVSSAESVNTANQLDNLSVFGKSDCSFA